jgi:hypothetical protein
MEQIRHSRSSARSVVFISVPSDLLICSCFATLSASLLFMSTCCSPDDHIRRPLRNGGRKGSLESTPISEQANSQTITPNCVCPRFRPVSRPICHNLLRCGRYKLSRRKQLVEEYFDCSSGESDWTPRYNIAPTQPVPMIRQNPKEPLRELCCKDR